MWEMGVGILLIGIAALLIHISFQLGKGLKDDDAGRKSLAFLQPLKLLLLGVSIGLIAVSSSVAINMAEANSASADVLANLSTFYIIVLWTMRLVIGYFMVYYVWSLAQMAIKAAQNKEIEEDEDGGVL